MTKLHTFLSLAVLAVTLGGCELYFGDKNGDKSSYCDSTGYYECTDGNCQLVSRTCPAGGTGGPCKANADCAAGCACDVPAGAESGTCVENGFCSQPSDCPDGMTCDDRSSCVPGCSDSNPCPKGQVCNADSRTCQSDPEACVAPSTDTAVCNTNPPSCPEHTVPTVSNGCWSGNCRAITDCNEDAACKIIQHEDDCLAVNTRCSAAYTGINCKKPDGTACKAGDANCTCQSFVFHDCSDRSPAGRQVTPDSNGVYHDINSL